MDFTIISDLHRHWRQHPERNALWVNHQYYTYQDLFGMAAALCRFLLSFSKDNTFCIVLCDKNITAYQSILAVLFSGKAYCALKPTHPVDRNVHHIQQANPEIIMVDSIEYDAIALMLSKINSTHIVVFHKEIYQKLKTQLPLHHYFYFTPSTFDSMDTFFNLNIVIPEQRAYLMFTSGSTGQPKGIAVSHANLLSYVHAINALYAPNHTDRFMQLCELTFDVSVHDLFVCWSSGACLYVVPENYMLGLVGFVQKHALSYWISVPSTVDLLQQLRTLKPGCFPTLKRSFFCGEIFLQSQALLWARAAPHSSVTNLYGPTEATVTVTYFDWQEATMTEAVGVPIGHAFSTQISVVLDDRECPVKPGDMGELCFSGDQVVTGYLNDDAKTAAVFKTFPWDAKQRLWYKTGDLARFDERFGYYYLGRRDDQWQIRGYRVEKLEIEYVLRTLINNTVVAVVPIKRIEGLVEGVMAFVSEGIDTVWLKKAAQKALPSPMVPRAIYAIAHFPVNQNGKIDYITLSQLALTMDQEVTHE